MVNVTPCLFPSCEPRSHRCLEGIYFPETNEKNSIHMFVLFVVSVFLPSHKGSS